VVDFLELLPKTSDGKLCLQPLQITAFIRIWEAFSHGRGTLYADEMGLGKTRVLVVFMAFVLHFFPTYPFLLVVPQHLRVSPWMQELEEFTGLLVFNCFPHGKDERLFGWVQAAGGEIPHVVMTTPEGLRADCGILERFRFWAMIVDEAQIMKTMTAETHAKCSRLRPFVVICATGTPCSKQPEEIYGLLRLIDPKTFTAAFYGEKFLPLCKALRRSRASMLSSEDFELERLEALKQLQTIIFPYIFRRTKDNLLSLKPIDKWAVRLFMSPLQASCFQQIKHNKGDHLKKTKCVTISEEYATVFGVTMRKPNIAHKVSNFI
jgi:SNF2 family DNA or RNA helicase